MAIVKRQAGEAAAVGQAGTMVGEAQRREKARQEALQIAAEQRAMQWELQKMTLNSQQDFAHEMRIRQAELDREARAKEWELEKMEIRSRLDFQEEEKERQQVKNEARAKKATLEKHKGEIPDEQYNTLMMQFDLQIASGTRETATAGALSPVYERGEIGNLIDDSISGKITKEELARKLTGKEVVGRETTVPSTPAAEKSVRLLGSMIRTNVETGLDETTYSIETPDGNIVEKLGTDQVYAYKQEGDRIAIVALTMDEYNNNPDQYTLTNLNQTSPEIVRLLEEAPTKKTTDPGIFFFTPEEVPINLPRAIIGSKGELLDKLLSKLAGETEKEREERKEKLRKSLLKRNLIPRTKYDPLRLTKARQKRGY